MATNSPNKNTYPKRWRFLKDWDAFAVPIKMYIHRNNEDMKGQEPLDSFGSRFGGVCSIFYFALLLVYAVFLIIRMHEGDNDTIKTQPLQNPFSYGYEKIDLFNGNFMPFLHI